MLAFAKWFLSESLANPAKEDSSNECLFLSFLFVWSAKVVFISSQYKNYMSDVIKWKVKKVIKT